MFPIADASGRVIAFSGRTFGTPTTDAEGSKYVNTPETELFRKSDILYAYDKAKLHMHRLRSAIVVEGTIDAVLAHQAGYRNTVAPLGTALTERHLSRLKQLTENVLLALDADAAGIASASRAAALALPIGFDVKVATLKEGSDPADTILHDPDGWKASIRNAQHIIDFLMDVHGRETKDPRVFGKKVRTHVLPFVARMENKIDQGPKMRYTRNSQKCHTKQPRRMKK
jgi:DNA primase